MKLKKIVVAPDSFKGSLTAGEVADGCIRAIRKVVPGCECVRLPVADGGEGTVEALASTGDFDYKECRVTGPLGETVLARYALSSEGETAVMEMAQAAGLTLIPEKRRNPLLTTTFGVGEMMLDAVGRGCRKICMGLGGSATNDGGMGMLSALGYRFLDRDGKELKGIGASLEKVEDIDCSSVDNRIKDVEFIAACDVDNPFYGKNGAAFVFAPQKGASPETVQRLDKGLRNFAEIIALKFGINLEEVAGSGAAGGLGGAFCAFLKAKMMPGIEMVLDAVNFDDYVENADLIITGEGSIDRQSLMGKVLSGVLERGRKAGVPVLAVGGSLKDEDVIDNAGFCGAFSIMQRVMTLEEAMQPEHACRNLETTVCQIMRLLTAL